MDETAQKKLVEVMEEWRAHISPKDDSCYSAPDPF